MKERTKVRLLGFIVGAVLGLLIVTAILHQGCDPLDPKNSVNAVYLEEPTSDRFTKIYVGVENSMEITVYKDKDYPGCELIVVCQSRGGNRFGLSIEYVVHPIRDQNIRIEP